MRWSNSLSRVKYGNHEAKQVTIVHARVANAMQRLLQLLDLRSQRHVVRRRDTRS
ncbi:MAG: hypothetical protein R3B96_09025 [Pirellulaceae bacterium]